MRGDARKNRASAATSNLRSSQRAATQSMNDLEAMFERVFEECVARDMKFPLILCAVASNGAIQAYKIHAPGRALWELAGHSERDAFMRFPINLMIVDRTDEAMLVRFEVEGVAFL
jgi:hypothetical protein